MRKNSNFLFLLLIMTLFGCQKDDYTEVEVNEDSVVPQKGLKISATDIPNVINFITQKELNYIPQIEHPDTDISDLNDDPTNPFGTIDLDQIRALINQENEQDKTYTFFIDAHQEETNGFYNLIVRVFEGEILRAYINKYMPTSSDPTQPFSGVIERYILDEVTQNTSDSFSSNFVNTTPLLTTTIENGNIISNQEDCSLDDFCVEEPIGNGNGSGNGSGGGGSNGSGDGGGSSGSGSSGSGPGGSVDAACDVSWVYHNCGGDNGHVVHGPDDGPNGCGGDGLGSYWIMIIDCPNNFTGNNNTNPSSFNDCIPCPNDADDVIVIPNNPDPVANLMQIVNITKIKNELTRLKNINYSVKEDGKRFYYVSNDINNYDSYVDQNFLHQDPIDEESDYLVFEDRPDNTLFGAHFHPSQLLDGQFVRRVPSGTDLAEQILWVKEHMRSNPGDTDAAKNITNFVVTNEFTYAIRVENLQKVLNLKGNYKKKRKAREDLAVELKKLILAPGVDAIDWTLHEEIIKQFIEDKDLGLVLYKAVYDGEEIITFEEL